MNRIAAAVFTGLLALCAAPSIARADGSAPRTHDGFYLRLGLGPGFATGSTQQDGRDDSADAGGVAVSTEISVGTTVSPGLVVGGGEFSMIMPAPKYTYGGQDYDEGAHHISGVGPFVDYYFDPKGGAHVQAALLLTAAYIQPKDEAKSATGFGFGGMVGAGYEFFIGEQWSIGPLLRLTYYRLSVKPSDSDTKSTLGLLAPSLLLGLTYH
jgi:hypothetical protein